RRGVGESRWRQVADGHDQFGRDREIAIDALARREPVGTAFDDIGKAPNWHPAEAILRREKVPITEFVAQHRIGDIVRGKRKARDPQSGLPRCETFAWRGLPNRFPEIAS